MFSFPLAYAFMPNRQKKTYDDLLTFLSELYNDVTGDDLTPIRCTLDFERASINSVLHIWPQTSVRLCSVHLQRNLRKKLQSIYGNFYEDKKLLELWKTLKSIHLVNWNEDLIQKYFDYLRTFKPKKKMKIFIDYLESTYFKFRLANGSFDPYSYRFWSWGQDIQTHDIKDTSSNTSESCNARLNKKVLTSHQKFPNSAQVVWESHGDVLDSYTQIFKHRETPSNKRKLATTQRWEFLTKTCEEFHKLEHQLQIDSLHNFLLKCASRISEPTEAIETDPQDNEKTPFSLDE